MKIETRRLRLRSAEPSDAADLYALFTQKEVLRYLPPVPAWTPERASQAIARRRKIEEETGFAPLIIETKDSGEFVGSGGLNSLPNTSEVELVYHLKPASWGRGYATESAIASLSHGLRILGLKEIIALCTPANVASNRVIEKAGMTYLGPAAYFGLELKKYVASRDTWTGSQNRGDSNFPPEWPGIFR